MYRQALSLQGARLSGMGSTRRLEIAGFNAVGLMRWVQRDFSAR
jgi:hypothetical protein